MARAPTANVIGYLLMDPHAHYWYDPANALWIAFTEQEPDGKEVCPFLPPAEAFHPDAGAARKAAAALQAQGIDARPTRVAYVAR